jgi:LmbE family N-acetylglucosaminyl deacetylase
LARRTLIVAHPDDELLFAGALLLESANKPDESWQVVVCTHDSGPRRAQLALSMKGLVDRGVNAFGYSLGLADRGLVERDYYTWRDGILSVPLQLDEVVYTHNPRGDYGHPHHVTVAEVVRSMCFPEQVRHFYYDGVTGVGQQDPGTGEIEAVAVTGKKKQLFLEAYEEHYHGICATLPEMSTELFHHCERFVSA